MLRTRVLVAAVALPVLTAVILIGGWLFALFVLAALLLAAWEYVTLWRKGHQTPALWLVAALVVLGWAAVWLEEPDWRTPGLIALLIAGMAQA
ncbi:MAG: phosphatidate cytidylyltransferase, partial [Chloroflexi bacterium]|nr:phosphatidate cytidylyltransferase [Chloroflexota bacterium]